MLHHFDLIISSLTRSFQCSNWQVNLTSRSFAYYSKTNYAKLLLSPTSHPSRCPLRSPHLPLILSIVPFPCETTDSRAVAYYSPVPRTPFDLLASRSFSFWSFAEDDRAAATMRREREDEETMVSRTSAFTSTICSVHALLLHVYNVRVTRYCQ